MIKRISILFIPIVSLICGCQNDNPSIDEGGNVELNQKILDYQKQLVEYAGKDSAINEYLNEFTEIEANLNQIKEKHGYIVVSSANDAEFQPDIKTRIMENINQLAELVADSKARIATLSSKLKNSDLQLSALEEMIRNQAEQIENQNLQILELQQQLADSDAEFMSLYESYQETTAVVAKQDTVINTAYYAYGTFKELKENGVVTKEGGFIGIGRIKKMSKDFNEKYFTTIDIRKTTEIILACKTAEIITNHPQGSYKIVGEKTAEKLVITNIQKFWSVSKYLIIIVDN